MADGSRTPRTIRVASFNCHAGIDGWGRPFDVADACARLDADVLVLEESWHPDGDPASGTGTSVAAATGMTLIEIPLAHGRRALPDPDASTTWMPSMDWRGGSHGIYLDEYRRLPDRLARSQRYADAVPGSWGLALLSRLPITGSHVVDLGRLRADRASRVAIIAEIEVGEGATMTVVGTHMSHLLHGSPIHYRRLRRALREIDEATPAVLGGDMNLWGPPVRILLGWRRAVSGRTWPAWRPHSQVDHILVHGPIQVVAAKVHEAADSDHRAVTMDLRLSR